MAFECTSIISNYFTAQQVITIADTLSNKVFSQVFQCQSGTQLMFAVETQPNGEQVQGNQDKLMSALKNLSVSK